MTNYLWDDQEQINPVDCAGCELGEIDRPARMTIKYNGAEQLHQLKSPSAPNGWIETQDTLDLEQCR